MNFREIENQVLDKYAEILNSKGYKLEREHKLEIWKDYDVIADAVIKDIKENILSIIEIKNNLRNKGPILHNIETIARNNNIPFYILINFIPDEEGITYIHELYSINAKTTDPIKIFKGEKGIPQIIDNLTNKFHKNLFLNDSKFLEEKFKQVIINFIRLQNNKNKTINNWQGLADLIESRKDFIIKEKKLIYFEISFEEKLFNLLLNPQKISSVCRYISFDSLFAMLYHKKFRMNDKSEIDYVENFIYGNNRNDNRGEIQSINNTFILSCCDLEKRDNLTMWRLYGDDAKGVNLICAIKDTAVDDFNVAEVIYDTQILELLKKVVSIFSKYGFKFVFKKLYYYKHFFKSKDYKEEKEIRLLYKGENKIQKKWQIAQPFNILNPYIEININEFPLQLREIILGPTLKEQMVNKKQLESLLIENGYHNIKISSSEIEHYRNSY